MKAYGRPVTVCRCIVSFLVSGMLAGCGTGSRPYPVGIQRADSAGVEIVVISGHMLDRLPERFLEPAPLLEVTGVRSVTGGVILPDHRVAVGDRVLAQVVVVELTGEVVRRFGQLGEGPGGFAEVSGLRQRDEDELVIWDGHWGRLVVFDTAGTFKETLQTPGLRTARVGMPFPGFLADGSPVFPRPDVSAVWFEGLRRLDFIVDRYAPDGSFAGALATIPGRMIFGVVQDRKWQSISVAHAGEPHVAVGGGRAFLGNGDRFEFQTWSEMGLERIVRVDRARQAVPSADQRTARAAALTRLASMSPELRGRLNAGEVPVSDSFPAFNALAATTEGGFWIGEGDPRQRGMRRWIVFDRSGEPVARVNTPKEFEILDVRDDLVWGVMHDDRQPRAVLLYRLAGSTDPSGS